jgi:hypothetical protein
MYYSDSLLRHRPTETDDNEPFCIPSQQTNQEPSRKTYHQVSPPTLDGWCDLWDPDQWTKHSPAAVGEQGQIIKHDKGTHILKVLNSNSAQTEDDVCSVSVTEKTHDPAQLMNIGWVYYSYLTQFNDGSFSEGVTYTLRSRPQPRVILSKWWARTLGILGSRHPGRFRTLIKTQVNYFWWGMYRDVDDFVASCDVCQKKKGDKLHRQGEARTPSVPTYPFETVHMDWITGLSPTVRHGTLTSCSHFWY